MAGGDDGGAEKGVEVFRAAVRTLACRTARAMDFARAEVFGAIQRDQHPPAQALEWGEDALGFRWS